MANKEATARIKINKLLEAAGWRFFPEGSAPANIRLEPNVTITSSDLEALGENFEKTSLFQPRLLSRARGVPHPDSRIRQRLRFLEPVRRIGGEIIE
jgi:type I restriction enzyme R subunit